VDGEAVAAGLTIVDATRQLAELEREIEFAMEKGYSPNLIVHAFARTARATGFGRELTGPFFDSMRADLSQTEHDQASFNRYVYGSAEVVGLMCLCAFLQGANKTATERAELEKGACALGAAFQKVNFLRDLGADFRELGRSYFPGITVESFSEADKDRLLDDIDHDLHVSALSIPNLPKGSRRAVALAQALFTELARRLRATPADQLLETRVRVPNPVKARLAAAAALGKVPSP
jgi:phytoene/squalene synthetase